MPLQEIRNLTRTIAVADARDQEQQQQILWELQDAWGRQLDEGSTAEVDSYFEFAIELVRYLAEGRTPGPEEILTMVTRFLARAERTMPRAIQPSAGNGIALKMSELLEPTDLRLTEEPQPAKLWDLAEELQPPQPLSLVGQATGKDEATAMNLAMGELLIHLGVVGAKQISVAMEQKLPGERIGQTCVRLNFASSDQIDEAARLQVHLRNHTMKKPVSGGILDRGTAVVEWRQSLLGKILVDIEAITDEQLQQALDTQRASGLLLGESLVQAGASDWDTVRRAIRIQEEMRTQAEDPWRQGQAPRTR